MEKIEKYSIDEKENPLISVVVPLYNKKNQIRETVKSIINQDSANFEVIIVDDGSDDGSVEIIKEMSDPRIRLITRENGGDGAARNTGIRAANGEIVAFLDADDEWMQGFLAEIVILKQKFPDAGMFATGYRVKYRGNYSVDVFVDQGNPADDHMLVQDYFKLSIQRGFITSSNVAIVRSVFDKVGTFYEKLGASCDRDMWARVALKFDVACSSKVLAIYNCAPLPGRVSRTKRPNPPPPAISQTVKKMIDNEGLGCVDKNLLEYVNVQWFDRVDKSIKGDNIKEAKRILDEEIVKTKKSLFKWLWLACLIRILPLPLIQAVRKFQKSRWAQPWIRSFHRRSYPRVSQKVIRLD